MQRLIDSTRYTLELKTENRREITDLAPEGWVWTYSTNMAHIMVMARPDRNSDRRLRIIFDSIRKLERRWYYRVEMRTVMCAKSRVRLTCPLHVYKSNQHIFYKCTSQAYCIAAILFRLKILSYATYHDSHLYLGVSNDYKDAQTHFALDLSQNATTAKYTFDISNPSSTRFATSFIIYCTSATQCCGYVAEQ